ncbi:hypothetical protein [Bosea robiniae]|uniref:Uncharacterized protein n=1 Tax=Bosea robiniae TaxID=1036780 RepID=A0ABY0P461_9HYPH|nr:hypothetical protein [Bosea robiniae]SDH22169.1 hypothetical protein SAMN05421844_107200 [Bosea robiniae]
MSFVVITSVDAYDLIVESGEMPDLLALGIEIVLVRPLYDELVRDPATAHFIAAHSPPFVLNDPKPSRRVNTAVAGFRGEDARSRVETGGTMFVIMAGAGEWIGNPKSAVFVIAGEGMVDGIEAHLGLT